MADIKTLQQAVIHFSDFENCKREMVELRWPDGKVKCPQCGSEKVTYLAKARVWKCYGKHDRPKFSLKTGTIFEDSPIGLDKWLAALWLVVNCKNGISSCESARDLGVTQKTAWFMNHRIREAMQDPKTGRKLGGEVEVDETFIGGKARNMHAKKRKEKIGGRGPEGKAIVAAVLQRGGKVRATVIEKRKKKQLQELVRENVKKGSAVYTDDLLSYDGLEADYAHQTVNHADTYVNEQVHTNGLENFWSLLKRGLNGTYISVEPFHLFRYVDEQSFRFNNRVEMNDYDRFRLALSQITGKRLTYEHLTGKDRADTEVATPVI
jgi:transposase-like protein